MRKSKDALYRTRLKTRLYLEQNGECFWCKVECILFTRINGDNSYLRLDKEATVDHVYQKGHPLRNTGKKVMACHLCNNKRSNEQQFNKTKFVIPEINHEIII